MSFSCFSQEYDDVLSVIDEEQVEAEADYEELEELFHRKLNLNDCDDDDCARLFFLSEFEKQSLLYFLSHNRPLLSVYELQFVLGLPPDKVRLLAKISYAGSCGKSRSLEQMIADGKHTVSSFTSFANINADTYKAKNKYQGPPWKEVVRYRFQSHDRLFWGATLKKDMGEPFAIPGGFDSRSFYVQYRPRGVVSNIALGDYKLSVAQGLILSQGGGYGGLEQSGGKSAHVLTKHSSTSEFEFSRGIAFTARVGKTQLTPFVSFRNLDGKTSDGDSPFTIAKTGYHRTASEIRNKGQIRHTLFGAHLQQEYKRLRIGVAALQHSFEKDSVAGRLRNASVFFSYRNRKFRAYGECAVDNDLRLAAVQGFQQSLNENLLLSQIFRAYQKGFQSFMSSAVGRQSSVGNELGATTNIRLTTGQHTYLIVENDIFLFPNETSTVKAPTKGDVLRAKFSYKDYRGNAGYYQCSFTAKTAKLDDATFDLKEKMSHKLYFSTPLPGNVQMKVAAQASVLNKEVGSLLYADVVWKAGAAITASFRVAYFDASYETRQYAWEDDVSYQFSSSQYMYAGTYCYALLKWKVSPRMRVQAKLSQTRYSQTRGLPETYGQYTLDRKLNASVFVQMEL